jgi:hypothetical protein
LELAHAKRLRPFHLEMMVKRTWDSKAIGPWPQAVLQTLGVLATWFSVVDPADGVTRLDAYLTPAARTQAVATINGCAAAAATAEQHRLAGRVPEAFEPWQVVYRHTIVVDRVRTLQRPDRTSFTELSAAPSDETCLLKSKWSCGPRARLFSPIARDASRGLSKPC